MKKLPSKLKINLFSIIDNDISDELFNAITDYLTDKYGFCVSCVSVMTDDIDIEVDWDTTE